MSIDRVLECTFLIPTRRDVNLSDGKSHPPDLWEWLALELFDRFRGFTVASGLYQGIYCDPDTGDRVNDTSRKYTVAIAESHIDDLRSLLSAAGLMFQQKAIYLSVAGVVEFILPSEK